MLLPTSLDPPFIQSINVAVFLVRILFLQLRVPPPEIKRRAPGNARLQGEPNVCSRAGVGLARLQRSRMFVVGLTSGSPASRGVDCCRADNAMEPHKVE